MSRHDHIGRMKDVHVLKDMIMILMVEKRYNPSTPLSTALYTSPSTIDFATRLAKVLSRRTGKAAHVGSSVSFEASAQGGIVEEEMEGFRRVVGAVIAAIEGAKGV